MHAVALILAAGLAAGGITVEPIPAVRTTEPHYSSTGGASGTSGDAVAVPQIPGSGASVPAARPPAARPTPSRPAAPDPRSTLEITLENQLLAEEVKLARQPRIYLFFDIPNNVVQMKARGAVFREFTVAEVRSLGDDLGPGPRALSARKTSAAPKRFRIEPPPLAESAGQVAEQDSAQAQTAGQQILANEPEEKSAKSAAEELSKKALEVTDMPRQYDLVFDKELQVMVLPKVTGFGGRLSSALSKLGFFLKLPYRILAAKKRRQPLTIILMSMEAADAQALYWAFPEGTKALFRLELPKNSGN